MAMRRFIGILPRTADRASLYAWPGRAVKPREERRERRRRGPSGPLRVGYRDELAVRSLVLATAGLTALLGLAALLAAFALPHVRLLLILLHRLVVELDRLA